MRISKFAIATGVIAGLGVVVLVIMNQLPHSPFGVGFLQRFAPVLLSSKELKENLSSGSRRLIIESLGVLQERKDPVATQQASQLLNHPDNYIWLNAALYLGTIRETNAIPFLIEGLRHPAFKAHEEAEACLGNLTGQSFGRDYEAWRQWWLGSSSNSLQNQVSTSSE